MRSEAARSDALIAPFLGFIAAAVFLVGMVMLTPMPAFAGEPTAQANGQPQESPPNASPPCSCGDRAGQTARAAPIDPKADLRGLLDQHDQTAVFQALHLALSEVADGSSYVWHRSHGRLSGVVQINGTTRNGAGSICRRMTIMLTSGTETRKIATSACRLADRSWQIVGS